MSAKKKCEKFHNELGCSRDVALNKAFEESPIGEAFVDADGRFAMVNKAFAKLLDYEMSELSKMTYKDVNHKKDIIKSEKQARAVLQHEILSYDIEKRYIKKNGESIWVHVYINAIFDKEENFQHFVIRAIDINNKKIQEAITDFASASGDVGIWIWHVDKGRLAWNKEMYKIFAIDKNEEINYETWSSALTKEDKKRVERELKESLKSGKKFESYFKINTKDGQKYIRAKGERFGPESDSVFIGSNIDVTDFTEMQDEIEKNHKELEYFTYSVSHDLKAPLVTLSGFSSIISHELNEGSIDWELIKDSSNEIQKATQQLSSTIDSILHLSRMGRIYIEESHVNTKEMVDEIINLNSIKIKNSNVNIINEKNISIFVQREIFTSIVQNMIVNAIDHAAIKDQLLDITIDFEETENEFFLYFKDNGKGMSQEQLENLFSYESRQYAKGFGMMIIKEGIDFHGGKIEIKSELNKGTSYRVRFNKNGQ